MKQVKAWSNKDRILYFSTALLSWIILTLIALYYSYQFSIYALIGYIVIYVVLVFIQARDWCIGCPYRGRFCPGILCMGLANYVSSVFFKDKKFVLSKRNEHIVSIVTFIYFVYPIHFIFPNWMMIITYTVLLIVHLLLIWKFFCPKCKFNKECPGGKVSTLMCRYL